MLFFLPNRLIINDCLDTGTQFPYIKWAIENNFGVIVANPNLNFADVNGEERKIRVLYAILSLTIHVKIVKCCQNLAPAFEKTIHIQKCNIKIVQS